MFNVVETLNIQPNAVTEFLFISFKSLRKKLVDLHPLEVMLRNYCFHNVNLFLATLIFALKNTSKIFIYCLHHFHVLFECHILNYFTYLSCDWLAHQLDFLSAEAAANVVSLFCVGVEHEFIYTTHLMVGLHFHWSVANGSKRRSNSMSQIGASLYIASHSKTLHPTKN